MKLKLALFASLFILTFLGGCNFPTTRKITATPNVTQAYETIIAQMSTMQAAGTVLPQATVTPVGQSTSTPEQALPTQPFKTIPPSTQIIPTQVCDRVLPGNPIDVTIPDDSSIPSGEGFTKTWRLQNGGACAWTKEYQIVWVSGERMADLDAFPLPDAVPPGESIDLSLDMTAPTTIGTYQSNWMLRNSQGILFGIGPTGKSPFWVRIVVSPRGTPTVQPSATAIQPGIVFSGVVSLLKDQTIHIGTGAVTTGNSQDMSFTGSEIQATNNSSFSSILNNPPDYSTCSKQTFSTNSYTLDSSNLYAHYCVKNSLGQIGAIQILGFSPDSSLTLEIQTWGAD